MSLSSCPCGGTIALGPSASFGDVMRLRESWKEARAQRDELVALLREVKESLAIIDKVKLPFLSDVVHDAFIGTEQRIDATLAKLNNKETP